MTALLVTHVTNADTAMDGHAALWSAPVYYGHAGEEARMEIADRNSQSRYLEQQTWDALAEAHRLALELGYGVTHISIDRLGMERARAVSAQLKAACADLDWATERSRMHEAAQIDLIGWRRNLTMQDPRSRAIIVIGSMVGTILFLLFLIKC